MDNYLVDRETLAQFVDEIMKQKPLAANTPEEVNQLRERLIAELDQKIGHQIFGSLTRQQLADLTAMMDQASTTEDDIAEFFKQAGLDLNAVLQKAVSEFAQEFLGGEHA